MGPPFTYTSIVQPILQAKVLYNPFYTVCGPVPPFTYTSIVQPLLQANNPFYTAFEPVFRMMQDDAPPQAGYFQPQGCSGRSCQHLKHTPMCSLHICGHFDTKYTLIRHLEVI